MGNTLYFTADDNAHGVELWKSDGTAAGTVLVRDIYPGASFDGPDKIFLVYNSQLYFSARDTAHDIELWRTDGGPDGAVLVRDACPTDCDGATYSVPAPMAVYQGKLYLNWRDFSIGEEFWVTDGTAAGSALVKDINPGGGGSDSRPYAFTVFQDKLYFAADSADTGSELWVSDGTAAGTRPVKNINTSPFGDCEMDAPVVGPDAFYFWARKNNGDGRELWKSDGTAAGTVQVKDINPGAGSGQPNSVPLNNSAWVGNRLLFTATDGASGAELWATDGTETGTQLLADINPGAGDANIAFLATLGGRALFRANNGTAGNELWTSDGTPAGTQLLLDINPGAADGLRFSSVPFAVFQNKMIFTANDGAAGRELWITDGTTAGTALFADADPGAPESNPSNYHVAGNTLFFFATTAATGRELWTYDLTSVGVRIPAPALALRLAPTLSSDGHFILHLTGEASVEPYRVEVFDAAGRLLTTRLSPAGASTLDLPGLPAGVCLVRLTGEASRRTGVARVLIAR